MYNDNSNMDAQIVIINELSKHDELLKYDAVINWVQGIRYNIFETQKVFSERLHITVKGLLLTSISTVIVADYACKNHYSYDGVIGKYLLINLNALPNNTINQKIKRIKKIRLLRAGILIKIIV